MRRAAVAPEFIGDAALDDLRRGRAFGEAARLPGIAQALVLRARRGRVVERGMQHEAGTADGAAADAQAVVEGVQFEELAVVGRLEVGLHSR